VNRFSFDLNTLQRIKIKSEFTYPLQIDMGPYQSEGSINLYEFIGVLVHRGNPYGGHYFLICKD